MLSYRLPGPTAAAMAWATAHVPIAQVSLAAHTDPNAAEPQAVLRDAQQEARRFGVPTPRLDATLT
jgi:2-dehydropantoate 2-reductase